MFLRKYEEKLSFLTEGALVTHLSGNVEICDELCVTTNSVFRSGKKDFIPILNVSFRHMFQALFGHV